MRDIGLYRCLALGLLLMTGSPAQAAVSLGFAPVAQTAGRVEIAITVSGLGVGSANALAGYDLDIHFDSSHLAFAGTVFGDLLLGAQLDVFGYGDNPRAAKLSGTGVLNVFELSLDAAADLNPWQADSFTLATLGFDVLRAGNSELSIGINAFADADGGEIVPDIASVTVTTVPLPSAMWSMLLGLSFVCRLRRRAITLAPA